MKERASSAKKGRTYDADGYIQRAGCVCFKTDSEKEVCCADILISKNHGRSVDPMLRNVISLLVMPVAPGSFFS